MYVLYFHYWANTTSISNVSDYINATKPISKLCNEYFDKHYVVHVSKCEAVNQIQEVGPGITQRDLPPTP